MAKHQQPDPHPGMTRREMLRSVARVGALAGVVASLTVLVSRRNCDVETLCTRCGKFSGCDLDKAQEARVKRG